MFRNTDLSRRSVLIFLYVSILVPMVPIVLWSFSFRWVYPNLLPEWSTRAWEYVFEQRTVINATVNSIVLSAIVTLLSLIVGFSTAKALGTREFRGKSVVEMFILLPAIIPVISAVMGMQGIFIRLYISDTFVGVVLAQLVFTMPYMIMGLPPRSRTTTRSTSNRRSPWERTDGMSFSMSQSRRSSRLGRFLSFCFRCFMVSVFTDDH